MTFTKSLSQKYYRLGAWCSNPQLMLKVVLPLLLIAIYLSGSIAIGGTTGTEFKPAFDFITNSFAGYLGRAIIFGALAYGAFIAAGKQQPSLAAGAIVLGFFVMIGPNVLNGMVSATI